MHKKAFTLVELIVVITILAILATVAFISFQGYGVSSRDSVRISDIRSIEKVLSLYHIENNRYPDPSDLVDITYSGSTAWTQGIYGNTGNTSKSTLSDTPVDPITDLSYAYSVTNTKQEYQIGAVLEGEISTTNIIQNSYAGDQLAQAYIRGNYNGKLIKVDANNTTYLLGVPSIFTSDVTSVDIIDIINTNTLVYKGENNLPASLSGSVYDSNPTDGFNFTPNQIVLFEGDISELENDINQRIDFFDNLQTNYEGTSIEGVSDIAELLSVSRHFSSETSNYVSAILNNSIGTQIELETIIPQPITSSECYDPVNIGTVGQQDWTGCEGLLIVNNWSGTNGIYTAVRTGITIGGTTYGATDIFTGQVTIMQNLFRDNTSFNEDIGYWDTSNVVDMHNLFWSATSFNQDISNWDTSNVTSMSSMFFNAEIFNQPLNAWDTSNVTSISTMFTNADTFDQPLNRWDVSNVVNMSSMFQGAMSFNQDISNWDTSNVTSMNSMFNGATAFDQSLNSWNTSNVLDMNNMFIGASRFNQPLNRWDVSNVLNMQRMFFSTVLFNQDISTWDTSNVTNMLQMFRDARSFNQDISTWDTSSVTDMSYMFFSAVLFDQDLSNWCVTNVSNHTGFYTSTGNWDKTDRLPIWGTCPE